MTAISRVKQVRLGFIGCGFMGQLAHLANHARLPGVELAALSDLRPRTPHAVAEKYGIPRVYQRHTDMLKAGDLDAVVAIMNFACHADVVPDVLNAGLHLFTEKPAAVRPETASRHADMARKRNLVYHVGYMKRCDPASIRMREIIRKWQETGAQGKLKYLRVTMPPGDWLRGIEAPISLGDSGEGAPPAVEPCPEWMTGDLGEKYIAFINFYIHQVNLIRFLLEEDFELEHVDGGEMVLVARSSSGVTIVLEMNTHALQGDWLEEYVAHFDRGLITMSLPAPMARQDTGKVSVYRHREEGAIVEQPQIDLAWSMTEQAKRFVEEVRGEQPNVSPPEDAARDLEIAEAYIRLVQKGRSK